MRSAPVLQVFVHGDSLQVKWTCIPFTFKQIADFIYKFLCFQSYLVGIVVPDPEVFVDWAKDRGLVGSYKELCQNPVRCSQFQKLSLQIIVCIPITVICELVVFNRM